MDKFFLRITERSRDFRTKQLDKIGRFFLKLGWNANRFTSLSLLAGLIAVYFLFLNRGLFILFVLLHLFLDSFDGVLARISGGTNFGKYFDLVADNLPIFLIIIKAGWYLQDYYTYIVAGMFLLSFVFYFWSKLEAPLLPMRTVVLIYMSLVTFIPYTKEIIIAGYLLVGAVVTFSLARQLQWVVKNLKQN